MADRGELAAAEQVRALGAAPPTHWELARKRTGREAFRAWRAWRAARGDT